MTILKGGVHGFSYFSLISVTVNSFNFVGTNFRGLGKKGISWDS
jgi:hypothetical protein